mgnify:CR=1 FL=1
MDLKSSVLLCIRGSWNKDQQRLFCVVARCSWGVVGRIIMDLT